MAITVNNLGNSASPDNNNVNDQASYDSPSWSPPTCDLILCWIYNTKATTLGSAPTVTGNGLTWVQITSTGIDPGAQTHRLTLYAADARGGASTGITTASFAGVTQSSILMEFQRVNGVDLSGGVLAAFVQTPANSTASANSLAVNLSAVSNAANRFFAGIGHAATEATTFEAGWDKLDDLNGVTPGRGLAVGWDSDSVADVTPSASWATLAAAVGLAVEIKAAGSGASLTYTVTDSLGLTDAIIVAVGKILTLTNTLGLTDSVSNERSLNRTITNTAGVADAISTTRDLIRTIADGLGITDAISTARDLTRNIADGVGITDAISSMRELIRAIADEVGITDSVSISNVVIKIANKLLTGSRNLALSLLGKRQQTESLTGSRSKDIDLDGSMNE